jgi:acyl-CoA synthetase (NDP forming)
MLADVRRHAPGAAIDGVLVQRMAPKGHEPVVSRERHSCFASIR